MKLIIDIPEQMYLNAKEDLLSGSDILVSGIKNGIPLEQIRAEIEKVFCISVITDKLRTPMEVKTEILQIIDKYR